MASLVETTLPRLRRLRERLTPTGRARLVVAVVVVGGLAVASVLAVRSLPADARELNLVPVLILAAVTVPLGVVLNLAEFDLASRIVGASITRREELRISVQAMAANLLPLPGAALVRLNALRVAGIPLDRATRSLVAIGLGWLATALVVAGAVVTPRQVAVGLVFVAAGAAGFAGVLMLLRNVDRRWVLARLVVIEAGAVALSALRFWLAFVALGFDIGVGQAAALSASGAIAAAVGFLPGGLGLKEAIATALAPAVGLGAAETLLAAALDRAVGLVALVPVAAVALFVGHRSQAAPLGAGLSLEGTEPVEQ